MPCLGYAASTSPVLMWCSSAIDELESRRNHETLLQSAPSIYTIPLLFHDKWQVCKKPTLSSEKSMECPQDRLSAETYRVGVYSFVFGVWSHHGHSGPSHSMTGEEGRFRNVLESLNTLKSHNLTFTVEDRPLGYPHSSAPMASHGDLFFCRRFLKLSITPATTEAG